jgi:hypothetical protein
MATKKGSKGSKKGMRKVKAATRKGSSPSPKKKATARRTTKMAAVKAAARKPSRARPSPAKPSRAKPSRAKPSRAKPSRAKPSRAKPSPAKPSRSQPVARRAAKALTEQPTHVRASKASAVAAEPIRREDRPGHFDPRYRAKLREQGGQPAPEPQAFIGSPRSRDDLAEELGEDVVERATSGEDETEAALDQIVPEEQGGPFIETNAAQEFAHGTDASNPKGAKREPFPRS